MEYEKYGLTREKASALGIRLLDYVAIESPDFVREITTDDSNVARLIDHYELVWTLTVEEEYARRRGWNDMLAFREFLQNALDEEHEVYGYDGISVQITMDGFGTWVKDRGRGITYKAFMLGGEDKPCNMRGAFGEGLKIGALWFAVRRMTPYLFVKDVVYKCAYSGIAKALVVVFGRSKIYHDGTAVLIHDFRLPKGYEKIYYKNTGMSVVAERVYPSSQCNYEMPNLILKPGGTLYVRDIFVNTMDALVRRKAYYSYNLWWVKLEPNRVQVQSSWELDRRVAELLSRCPSSITEIFSQTISRRNYGGITYYMIEPKYYELELSYDYPPENTKVDIARFLASTYGVTAYTAEGDLDGVAAVNHEGGVCLVAPSNLHPLLSKLPEASEFVVNNMERTTEKAVPLDPRTYTQEKRGLLRAWEIIKNEISQTKDVELVTTRGDRSFYYSDGKRRVIYLSKGLPFTRTFVHELAHAYGEVVYGSAPDVSENFERALEEISVKILSFQGEEPVRAAIQRAKKGAIYAEPKLTYEFFGDLWYRFERKPPMNFLRIYENPARIIAYAPPFKPRRNVDWSGAIIVLDKPAEEAYRKRIALDKLHIRKALESLIKGTLSVREAKEYITENCNLYLSVEFLETVRVRKSVEVFYYDLEKDRYEVLFKIEGEG